MKNLRHVSLQDLEVFLAKNNQPKFRAKQILDWLWKKNVSSIDEMTNVSKDFRELLSAHFFIPTIQLGETQYSEDGTIKTKFILHDNEVVEGVLIPTSTRMTACISSQVGCSLTCKFCATGKLDRKRNLDFDEIVDQVVMLNRLAEKNHGKSLTNIVYMGMGEPMLNYQNVMKSIEKISSPDGLAMSPKRITVSTAGIAKMIRKMGDDGARCNLALSLHAANDAKRNEIMPINETNNLEELTQAMDYYFAKTKNHVTYEYVMLRGFNDTEKDALELVKMVRRIPSKVNLIEYNSIGDAFFQKSDDKNMLKFQQILEQNKVNAKVRKSRGKDIDAACGQLANKTN